MTATDTAIRLAQIAGHAAADKLGTDIVLIDVSDRLAITDVFVIATGNNERQVEAIVDEVEERLRRAGVKPLRREGKRDGRWVLLDYSEIVVHVQHAEERVFYSLERLWKDCPFVDFDPMASGPKLPDIAPVLAPDSTDLGDDFDDADFDDADRDDAELGDAELGDAELGDADLVNADSVNADLVDADLDSAELGDADLEHADLNADAELDDPGLDGPGAGLRSPEAVPARAEIDGSEAS